MSKIFDKKLKKRKRIIESALKLFNEKGYANTKIDDIISHSQIGKGTFYLYFKNKENLVESLLEEVAADLLQILEWVSGQIVEFNDLRKVFTEEGNRLGALLTKNKEIAIFINKQVRSVSSDMDKAIQEFLDTMVDLSSLHFKKAVEQGQLKADLDPTVMAMVVIGGINFTYEQWALGHVKMEVQEVVEALLNIYLNALGLKDK